MVADADVMMSVTVAAHRTRPRICIRAFLPLIGGTVSLNSEVKPAPTEAFG